MRTTKLFALLLAILTFSFSLPSCKDNLETEENNDVSDLAVTGQVVTYNEHSATISCEVKPSTRNHLALGVCYSATESRPTIDNAECKFSDQFGDLLYSRDVEISGLDPGTKYYYRTIVRYATGYEYGEVANFTTKDIKITFEPIERTSKEFHCTTSEFPYWLAEEAGFFYSKSSTNIDETSERIAGSINYQYHISIEYPRGIFDKDIHIRPYVKLNSGKYILGNVETLKYQRFQFFDSYYDSYRYYISKVYVITNINIGDDRGNLKGAGFVVGKYDVSINDYIYMNYGEMEYFEMPTTGIRENIALYDDLLCSGNLYNYWDRGYYARPYVEYNDGRILYGDPFPLNF